MNIIILMNLNNGNPQINTLDSIAVLAHDYTDTIITTIREPSLILDQALHVITANKSFYKTFQVNEQETIGMSIYELGNRQWNHPALRKSLDEILSHNTLFKDFEVRHDFPVIGNRVMLLNACEFFTGKIGETLILLTINDITEPGDYHDKKNDVTQVLTQRNLEESENFTRKILENNPDCVKILDVQGRIKFMNTNGLCLMDIDDFTKVENKYWWELWEKDNELLLKNAIAKAINGEKVQFQAFNPTKKGISKWWDIIVSPLQEINSKVKQIICVSRDITEQKQTAIMIEESEHRYKQFIHSSPQLIAILKGKENIITIANDAIVEIWGKGKDVIGKPFFVALPELVEQGVVELIGKVYLTGIPFQANEMPVNILRYGRMELRYYSFVFQPQCSATGEIEGVAIIGSETTSQAILNKTIKESEERFRSLADDVPLFAFIIESNPEATISYWNKTWLEYTGQTFEEAIRRGWYGIIHPDDVPGVKEIYFPAFKNKQPYFLSAIRIKRYDGVYRWHMVKCNPRFLPDGEFIGYLGVGVDIHESKLTEQALKESEERNRLVTDLLPEKVTNADANGNINYYNQSWIDFTGESFEGLINNGWGKWIHPDELEETSNHWQNSVKTGIDFKRELRLLDLNGTYKWHLSRAQPVKDLHGKIKLWIGVTTEIQDQKKQNEELGKALTTVEESNKRYYMMLMESPIAFSILKGNNMVVTLANALMKDFWGKGNDVEGKALLAILPELKDQPFPAMIEGVYKTGIPVYANEILAQLKHNGKIEDRYFNIFYQPYYETDESISGVTAIAYEVTELVLSRKRMEVQTALFNDMLMTAPGFVCTMYGPDHVYQLVNEKYQSLFGKRQIQGKPILVALPELEGQGIDKLLDHVYNTGETYVGMEIPITLGHDENVAPTLHYFNFSYQPMYNEYKKIYSILVFGYEVTEQVLAKNKNLENEQFHRKELEERVQQRTLELSEANADLVKINKQLESFTYISSHDLQEPLRKIQAFSDRILKSEHAGLSEKGKDYFKRMQDAALRMQILIEDLLAYSHTNNSDISFENTDFNKIVDDVKNDLSESILEKNAIIEKGQLCEVRIIPSQFRQVIHNLISNALKFSKPGVTPHVIIKSESGEGRLFKNDKLSPEIIYCHITVTDNGIGFDPQYKDQIFEVFQRLHNKHEYIGTGIGLAIVKKVLENHKGVITASGTLNLGATFDIYIPVV